jgi:hypothetical protein
VLFLDRAGRRRGAVRGRYPVSLGDRSDGSVGRGSRRDRGVDSRQGLLAGRGHARRVWAWAGYDDRGGEAGQSVRAGVTVRPWAHGREPCRMRARWTTRHSTPSRLPIR